MHISVALIAALIKIILAIGFILTAVPMLTWLERKLVADFQARIGPNRVGPFGLLQAFADGIKLVMKESIVPTDSDKLLYFGAPIVVMLAALSVLAVIPFGGYLTVDGYVHHLIIASVPGRVGVPQVQPPDLPIGLLFILALTSLSVYGIVLSGWASNSKYSLLGGLRSSAQMVSYELPMGLSLIAGLMIAGYASPQGIFGLSLSQVVDAQAGWLWNWTAFNYHFLFLGTPALLAFYTCGLAETNRAPFDLPEAETELVGGYHTEYGGLRWAMFFLGEYAAMLNVSAVASTVFLGGWHAPYPDTALFPAGSIGFALQGLFWFGAKVFAIIFIYMWLRATLPRVRYDQLMAFTWKWLLPVTLGLVLLVGAVITGFFRQAPPAVLTQNVDEGFDALPARMGPGGLRASPPNAPMPGEAPGSRFPAPANGPSADPGSPIRLGNGPMTNPPATDVPAPSAPVANAPGTNAPGNPPAAPAAAPANGVR
jgi:NADH-quinone oxidoreductase subunit H